MKVQTFSILFSAVELVGAGPRLFPRVQEKQCSANWYSTAFRADEASSRNCVYSDSQDKCDKGLSMAVDEKTCPLGKIDTLLLLSLFWIFLQVAEQNCSRKS